MQITHTVSHTSPVPPEIHDLPVMNVPPVERELLPNGVEIVWLNSGHQPVSRISVVWPIGTADVDSAETLALLREMLPEGTPKHSGAEIAGIFEFNGTWTKVTTGRHFTMFTLYALNKTVDTVWPLMGEIIMEPTFPEESLARLREKSAAATELSQRKVKVRSSNLIKQMIFGADSPAARIKSPEILRLVERDSLIHLHRRLMLSTPPTIFVAGQLSPSIMQMARRMGESFCFTGLTSMQRTIIPQPEHTGTSREVDRDTGSMQTAVNIALPTIGRMHPDYVRLRAAVFALGGHFGSRLMSNIREDKGYTYGISASMQPSLEGTDIQISCENDNRFTAEVLKETFAEIDRLSTEPMPTEELEVIKRTSVSGMLSMLDSPFSILDHYIMLKSFNLPDDTFCTQQQQLRNLSARDILEAARTYILPAPRLIALAGDPDLQ